MNPSNGSGRIDGRNGSGASNFGSILQGSTPSPIRLLADNRLCGGSCSIFASTVILHKMEVSGMQALPSYFPPLWLWFMAEEGKQEIAMPNIEGANLVGDGDSSRAMMSERRTVSPYRMNGFESHRLVSISFYDLKDGLMVAAVARSLMAYCKVQLLSQSVFSTNTLAEGCLSTFRAVCRNCKAKASDVPALPSLKKN